MTNRIVNVFFISTVLLNSNNLFPQVLQLPIVLQHVTNFSDYPGKLRYRQSFYTLWERGLINLILMNLIRHLLQVALQSPGSKRGILISALAALPSGGELKKYGKPCLNSVNFVQSWSIEHLTLIYLNKRGLSEICCQRQVGTLICFPSAKHLFSLHFVHRPFCIFFPQVRIIYIFKLLNENGYSNTFLFKKIFYCVRIHQFYLDDLVSIRF